MASIEFVIGTHVQEEVYSTIFTVTEPPRDMMKFVSLLSSCSDDSDEIL